MSARRSRQAKDTLLYGESKERGIRGNATREERESLIDEGIEVMSMPLPEALKRPLQ